MSIFVTNSSLWDPVNQFHSVWLANFVMLRTCLTVNGNPTIIYIHDRYQFEVRNLCPESRIWEGLFIDIYGTDLN